MAEEAPSEAGQVEDIQKQIKEEYMRCEKMKKNLGYVPTAEIFRPEKVKHKRLRQDVTYILHP